jgi:glycosyltransferase involved in cell wall biosynthesis
MAKSSYQTIENHPYAVSKQARYSGGSMSQLPLVSIVMPTYKRAQYLPVAIESILEQTYPHWELVIVDDCSPDNTAQVVADFVARDSRIKSIRHEVNRKLPASLNTGFSNASGAYFTWISDDNLFRPNALEVMVGFLEAHPDISLVYTDYMEFDDDGKPIQLITVDPPEKLGLHNPIGASYLFRRAVHEELNGYDEKMFLAEDLDFWVRTLIKFKVAPLHQDLYLYRQHPGSLTSTNRRIYKVHDQILDRYLPQMHWLTSDDKSHVYFRQASRALHASDMVSALGYMVKALQQSPRFFVRHSLNKALERVNLASRSTIKQT